MTKRDLAPEALRGHLVSIPALAPLVGQRVYQDTAPQNAPQPYIVFSRHNRPETYSKMGRANLITSYVQLTIAGRNKGDVRDISDIVRDCLAGFSGLMGTIEPYKVEVRQVRITDGPDAYDEDAGIYYRHQDIVIRHRYKEDE